MRLKSSWNYKKASWNKNVLSEFFKRCFWGSTQKITTEIFFSGFLFATAKVASVTVMIFFHIILHSAFLIYSIWFSYVHNFIIILSRFYNEPIQWSSPNWPVSSGGKSAAPVLQRSRFKSCTSLNFFSGFLFATAKVASITAMIFFQIIRIKCAKKIIFTACHSGKLKLAFTSPDVISTSPKNFFTSRIDFIVFLLFEFLKKHHFPVGQVKNRIH